MPNSVVYISSIAPDQLAKMTATAPVWTEWEPTLSAFQSDFIFKRVEIMNGIWLR
jgi:hypothetical protein